nr:PREDICTED: E3 ubiquitin-protein ligase Midline-1-like [Lepisosteus oculatus]
MERPGSPDPSNLSMKSDDSKEQHIDFGGSVIPDPSFTIHRFKIERPVSRVPSNLSMKSDDSKEQHIDFGGGSLTPDPRIQKDRPGSPSNLSLKSHVSKEQQIDFGDGSFTPDPRYSSPEDVSCDFCTGMKHKAVKYCQVCPAAYCVIHVRKHYTEPALQRHRLVEVNGDRETRLCQQHCKALELFCQTDQTLICSLCSAQEHRNHDTIFVKDEHAEQISAEEFYDKLSQKAHSQGQCGSVTIPASKQRKRQKMA